MDNWIRAKVFILKAAGFASCFAIVAVLYTSTEAQGEKSSPRFIVYNSGSGVAPFSKRSGRNVMGSSPIDWDADGDLDLIADQHIYENVGRGVFKKGQMLDFLRRTADIAIADLNSDDKLDIIEGFWVRPEIRVHYNLGKAGLPVFAPPKLLATAELFESVRPANRSAPLSITIPFVVDWNGDGLPDLLVSARDIWSDYFPYHPRGINRGGTSFGQIYGELYFLPNEGSRNEPRFPRAELVLLNGRPLVVFGISSPVAIDFDEDGDLDLLMTQEAAPVLFFENVGSRTKPLLKQPRHLYLDYPGIYSKLSIVDWNNDGLWDLLASSEDGEFLFRNTGKPGEPYFSGAYESLKEVAGPLWVPGFASPDAVDFDGDGDLDLVVGSDDGDFRLFENVGTQHHSVFAEGELLRYPDGQPVKIVVDSGYQPQGPVERFWGYSSPALIDWDGDGDLDLLSGQIGRSGYLLFENIGNRKEPIWSRPGLLESMGRIIRTTGHARMRPAPVDWNDDGLIDLIAVNERHEYVLYLRERDSSGVLRLGVGEVLRFKSGAAVSFTKPDDIVGRRDSVNVCDWDGDGDLDLITGLNSATGGFIFVENVGNKKKPVFADGVEMVDNGGTTLRASAQHLLEGFGHNPNIDVVDWNGDGALDLIVGQDMGFILLFDGAYIVRPKSAERRPQVTTQPQ